MIFVGDPKVLLDLIPDPGNHFVSFYFHFRLGGIDLTLPHDPVIDAVHAQEFPIGFPAVSLVGIDGRALLSMNAFRHHLGKVVGVMLGCS
jgi:hypothetical protein